MIHSKLTNISVLGLLCSLLAGCSETAPSIDDRDLEDESHISITLRIPTDGRMPGTRAYPSGGEDGDGREAGLNNENSLSDANIFFFKGSGFNPESVDPGAIEVAGVYVADLAAFTAESDENPFEKKVTIKVRTSETNLEEKGILTAGDVGFITVINAGQDLSATISDLKALREYSAFSSAWNFSEESGYKDFLMTTAYDAKTDGNVTIDGTTRFVGSNRLEKNVKGIGNPDIKWIGETTVQRLCARVDLMYKTDNEADGELVYVTPAGNKIHLTDILPVNFMEKPSYLLTKTTSTIPSSWTETAIGKITWGGVEKKASGSDLPANYVIEPTTLLKAAGTKALSEWYGSTASSTVKTDIADSDKGAYSHYTSTDISATENKGYDKALIIGYPNENVQSPTCYTSEFITGLALRAKFQPAKILKKVNSDYISETLTDEDWEAMTDKTIWRYQPTSGKDGVKESDALYFISEEDAETYRDSHSSDLATVTKYEDGVCYYNLWLRHYNDESYKAENADPKETYPMEFAIVRNNIYRVAVSFSGPGEPTPTLREVDTMMSRIFVRKWNLRSEKNPLQF